MPDNRDIRAEFNAILSPKDCSRYSKTAKSNIEDAVSKLEHTYKSLLRRLNNEEYTKNQPPVDAKVIGYYESIIGAFQSAVRNFVKTGQWSYTAPSTSESTKAKFDAFMENHNKYGSYFDGRPETVMKSFDKMVKNLTKNGFSGADLSSKKAAEEEAKKPKMPDKIEYSRFDTYDSKRMRDYKPNSRGEQMAHTAFYDKRARQFRDAKYYSDKHPNLLTYLNEIFTAFDNAWFSYVSGTTKEVNLKEVDDIYNKWTSQDPFIRKFDSQVCGQRMAYGGSATIWDCKDAMYKMENNRNKVIKTVTMEKEDTYSKWEKSVDAILNDEGKPSLNAYLDNWVEDITAYYTNPDNVNRWKANDARLKKEIKEYEAQISKMSEDWFNVHKSEKGQSWRYIRDGYQDSKEYTDISWSLKASKSAKVDNDRDLSIANMGETKIRENFKQQAADAKKAFVTAVCERAGVLQSGVFYWSAQHTGHLNGTVVGEDGSKWRITSFFAGGYNIQRLHTRTKITKLVK